MPDFNNRELIFSANNSNPPDITIQKSGYYLCQSGGTNGSGQFYVNDVNAITSCQSRDGWSDTDCNLVLLNKGDRIHFSGGGLYYLGYIYYLPYKR